MGSKNKLKRFKENETFKNVIQPAREQLMEKDAFETQGPMARKSISSNDHPIVLELGLWKKVNTLFIWQTQNPNMNYHWYRHQRALDFGRVPKTALGGKEG